MASMKPIPTVYSGIQMRSRLEATWAAFFDRMGWPWEYEPAVFDGPGWTPDFYLHSLGIFVEVKPQLSPFRWEDMDAIVYAAKRPVPDTKVVLFVGVSPVFYDAVVQPKEADSKSKDYCTERGTDTVSVAVIGTGMPGRRVDAMVPFSCYMEVWEDDSAEFGVNGCWALMPMVTMAPTITSAYGFVLESTTEAVREAWAEAKNAVQWRPPNGT